MNDVQSAIALLGLGTAVAPAHWRVDLVPVRERA